MELTKKVAKKKKKLHSSLKSKMALENSKKHVDTSNEVLETLTTTNEQSSVVNRLNENKEKKGKNAKLLPKKRKKHANLSGVDINKKTKEEDFKSTDITNSVTTSAEQNFDPNKLRVIRYHLNVFRQAKRSLFLKADASDPQSLIVLNIPPFISPESVKTILMHTVAEGCSLKEVTVKRSMIRNADPNKTYRAASARFENEYDVERVLRNCDTNKDVICLSSIGVDILPCGITKYIRQYRQSVVSADELQRKVDSFFEVHDARMLEEKEKAKRMHNVPDADGWITVTRSRFKPVPAAIVVKNKDDLLKLSKNKKRQKNDIPFYTFQLKQSKRKHLEELRQKFEEDKKKLALAKAARKFRPT